MKFDPAALDRHITGNYGEDQFMHTDSHLTDRYVIESLQALMEDAARDLAVACLGRPATYVEDALGDYRSAADINPDAPLHMWLADPLVHTYLTGLLVGHLNVPYQPAADAANEVLDELQGQFVSGDPINVFAVDPRRRNRYSVTFGFNHDSPPAYVMVLQADNVYEAMQKAQAHRRHPTHHVLKIRALERS